MSESKAHTSQSLKQKNFFLHKEIGTFSFEYLVIFLFNLNNNISRFGIRNFITFTMENLFVTMRRTFINFYIKFLFFLLNLFAFTGFTSFRFIYYFTLAPTFIAGTLSLRVHAWTKLLHNNSDTSSFACTACLNCTSIRSSQSMACLTKSVSFNFKFNGLSIVQIFKRSTHNMTCGFDFFLLSTASFSTATHTKKIEDVSKSLRLRAFFQTFFSVFIISFSFIFVH